MDLSSLIGIAIYVLTALGLQTIAKRRGINNPWLAWIPIADMWVLGCISDQYRHIVKNQTKTKRKLLPALQAVVLVLLVIIMILGISLFMDLMPYMPEELLTMETYESLAMMSEAEIEAFADDLMGRIAQPTPAVMQVVMIKGIVAGILGLATAVVAIVMAVQTYMAYYDLFVSANPKNATLYLVLGIVGNMLGLGLLLMAVFVFVCRELDEGMPPRQPQIIDAPPVWDQSEPPTYEL